MAGPLSGRWLIQNAIRLGEVSPCADLNVGATFDLAMTVASPENVGDPNVARGRAILLHGTDDEYDMRLRLEALDPTGDRRNACEERLIVIPCGAMPDSERMLFAVGAGGLVWPTQSAADLWQRLFEAKPKLVIFDTMQEFLPGHWTDRTITDPARAWCARLARATGAAVIVTIGAREHWRPEDWSGKCH